MSKYTRVDLIQRLYREAAQGPGYQSDLMRAAADMLENLASELHRSRSVPVEPFHYCPECGFESPLK